MDKFNFIEALWKILDGKPYAINVTSRNDQLFVSVISKRRIKRFSNSDSTALLSEIIHYMQE
jgi:hypothetical protein